MRERYNRRECLRLALFRALLGETADEKGRSSALRDLFQQRSLS